MLCCWKAHGSGSPMSAAMLQRSQIQLCDIERGGDAWDREWGCKKHTKTLTELQKSQITAIVIRQQSHLRLRCSSYHRFILPSVTSSISSLTASGKYSRPLRGMTTSTVLLVARWQRVRHMQDESAVSTRRFVTEAAQFPDIWHAALRIIERGVCVQVQLIVDERGIWWLNQSNACQRQASQSEVWVQLRPSVTVPQAFLFHILNSTEANAPLLTSATVPRAPAEAGSSSAGVIFVPDTCGSRRPRWAGV